MYISLKYNVLKKISIQSGFIKKYVNNFNYNIYNDWERYDRGSLK